MVQRSQRWVFAGVCRVPPGEGRDQQGPGVQSCPVSERQLGTDLGQNPRQPPWVAIQAQRPRDLASNPVPPPRKRCDRGRTVSPRGEDGRATGRGCGGDRGEPRAALSTAPGTLEI